MEHRWIGIQGCVVLHNLLLLFKDTCIIYRDDPCMCEVHEAAKTTRSTQNSPSLTYKAKQNATILQQYSHVE